MEYQILLTYFAKSTLLFCQVHFPRWPTWLHRQIAKSTMLKLIFGVSWLHFTKPGKIEIAQFSSQFANSALLFCQIAKSTSQPYGLLKWVYLLTKF
jgi:hypothetical protein